MKNFDEFVKSPEYKLWDALSKIVENSKYRQTDLVSKHDITDYWEPFLESLFKIGVCYKQTGKLKELKVKWMRPIFFIKEESKVRIDGELYEPPKECLDCGQEVRRRLADFSKEIEKFQYLDNTNWKANRKEFQKASGNFWKTVIKYVTKIGFRELNQVLKWILAPLLYLRKASLNLFTIECQEAGVKDFVIFKNRADTVCFVNNCKETFKDHEDLKFKKDLEGEDLDKYLEKVSDVNQYMYKFKKNNIVEDKVKDEMKISYFQFQKDALQEEFEKGLYMVFKYYFTKVNEDFYDIPDVRKLFTNLEVKDHNTRKSLCYYIDNMRNKIFDLKIILYDMKINGMSRIEIPIRNNEELTLLFKDMFYLYHDINRLIGDVLSYDQYLFFYECISRLTNSNFPLKNEIEHLKCKELVEDALPKYLILEAMRNAVSIENRIREQLSENNELFFRKNYYQITDFELDSPNMSYIYAHDKKRHPLYNTPNAQILNETRIKIEEDIIRHQGRYWILEKFFDPKDRDIWIEAIEILRNINSLVQDDIRDFILNSIRGNEKKLDRKESRSSSKKDVSSNKSMIKVKDRVTSSKKRNNQNKKGTTNNKNEMSTHSIDSDEESIIVNKKNEQKAENLRPPYVWNFPLEEIKMKNFLRTKTDTKFLDDQIPMTEIRKVDPRDFYKDGRVRQFLDLLNKITMNMLSYSKSKDELYKFFIESTLNSLDIFYYNQRKNN